MKKNALILLAFTSLYFSCKKETTTPVSPASNATYAAQNAPVPTRFGTTNPVNTFVVVRTKFDIKEILLANLSGFDPGGLIKESFKLIEPIDFTTATAKIGEPGKEVAGGVKVNSSGTDYTLKATNTSGNVSYSYGQDTDLSKASQGDDFSGIKINEGDSRVTFTTTGVTLGNASTVTVPGSLTLSGVSDVTKKASGINLTINGTNASYYGAMIVDFNGKKSAFKESSSKSISFSSAELSSFSGKVLVYATAYNYNLTTDQKTVVVGVSSNNKTTSIE